MSRIIYRKYQFIIFRAGDAYIVYNANKEFKEGHTHLKDIKSAIDAINFVHRSKIPKRCNDYYLRSLIRISENNTYIRKLEVWLHIRDGRSNTGCLRVRKKKIRKVGKNYLHFHYIIV